MIKAFLSLFEKAVVRLNRWKYIPHSQRKFMYVVPQVYKGKEIRLDDGTIIKKGDLVAEFHIDNLKMDKVKNDLKTIFLYLDEELAALANAASHNEKFMKIRAYYGRTVLHPIARKRGFTVIDLDLGGRGIFIKVWENILKVVFAKESMKSKIRFRTPKECWISKNQLLCYLDEKGGYNEKANY